MSPIINEIKEYSEFLTNTPEVKQKNIIKINELDFHSAITQLPTYYYKNKDSTYIEAIVKKQQYASGFQTMVYFCIPILCFSNGEEMIGCTSKDKELKLKYFVNEETSNNILCLFKVLAMASKNHQYDVIQILVYN